jgi:hypothetical protein
MKTEMRALVVTALAGSLALGSMTAMALPAAAAPATKDCGPVVQVVCTKTWDRATTSDFYETFNSWWFPAVRKYANPARALVEGVLGADLSKSEKDRAVDRLLETVNTAHDRQGCLQAKWRKGERNAPVEWTYTTGSACRF